MIEMCIFNTPVVEVKGTKIFVATTKRGRQVTCYRNYVSVDSRLKQEQLPSKKTADSQKEPTPAMILPFPAAAGSKKVKLLDLSKNKQVFTKLKNCFPSVQVTHSEKSRSNQRKSSKRSLRVHSVGAYHVSVAASLRELRRIDRSVFVVADKVDVLLEKHYGQGFGFMIAAFNPDSPLEKHPLGYVHDLSSDGTLFVPTQHYHSHDQNTGSRRVGESSTAALKEEETYWDHEIYSLGASGTDAGETVAEMSARLKESLHPNRETLVPPKCEVKQVLSTLPVKSIRCCGELRLLRKVGNHANCDTLLRCTSC